MERPKGQDGDPDRAAREDGRGRGRDGGLGGASPNVFFGDGGAEDDVLPYNRDRDEGLADVADDDPPPPPPPPPRTRGGLRQRLEPGPGAYRVRPGVSVTRATGPAALSSGASAGAAEGGAAAAAAAAPPPPPALVEAEPVVSSVLVQATPVDGEIVTSQGGLVPARWKRLALVFLGLGSVAIVAVIIGVVVWAITRNASPTGATTAPSPSAATPAPSGQTAAPTPALVAEFRRSLPSHTLERLRDESSPQSRAYRWATESDRVPQSAAPGDGGARLFRMTQRFALATLLYATGAPGWIQSNVSECEWGEGFGCAADSRIVRLQPEGSGGAIPREIGMLTSLMNLDLANNRLTSAIPTELGQLTGLTNLNLHNNSFTSTIPTELGMLTRLASLDLAVSRITSTIPAELGLLTELIVLNLVVNNLTSTIPTELGLLTGLTHLDLADNQLGSTIPTELGRLTRLFSLSLWENRLTSTIPTELGKLTALASLAFSVNHLAFTIPTELGLLTGLTYVNLYGNQLTSTVPPELGKLSKLEFLWLNQNKLTGTFPSAMCELNYTDSLSPHVDCAVSCSCCPHCNG